DDAVSVREVLLEVGGPAATEAGPQTGDRGGVSYPGLVLDLHRAQCGEELLDEVVLLVVQGGPAEGGDAHGAAQVAALGVGLLPGAGAGLQDPVGDHLHRRV